MTETLSRLTRYVALATEMCERAQETADRATELLRQKPGALSFRDRVMIGLALKMLGTFRALIDDARAERTETMHHYKPLVESYMHFHYVAGDASDQRAAAVLLKAHEHRRLVLRENEEGFAGEREFLEEEIAKLKGARIGPLPPIEQLATLAGVKSWYEHTYRAACEPAHINNLLDFMPDPEDQRLEGLAPVLAESTARTAIDWGIAVALGMFRATSDNSLGLGVDAGDYETQYKAIRGEA